MVGGGGGVGVGRIVDFLKRGFEYLLFTRKGLKVLSRQKRGGYSDFVHNCRCFEVDLKGTWSLNSKKPV